MMMFRLIVFVLITFLAMETNGQSIKFHKDQSRVVLVTGAANGIGRATAIKFRQEGYIVYATDIDTTRWEGLEKIGCKTLYLDVTDQSSIEMAFKKVEAKDKGIDILINNAGYGQYGAVENLSIEQYQKQLDVNLYGVIRVTQRALPYMRKRGKGLIMNTSSIAGDFSTPYASAYITSKFALEGFSNALRAEIGEFNIQVVIIKPSAVATNFIPTANRNYPKIDKSNPYYERIEQFKVLTKNAYQAGAAGLLSPEEVASIFYKAALKKQPKTRYRVGTFAKLTPLVQTMMNDRRIDKMMLNRMEKETKKEKRGK